MKPGITGMWQAYGRKTVSDFEEIVKMDLNYIDNWSIMLDIKILFKTVQSVLTTGGQQNNYPPVVSSDTAGEIGRAHV